MTRWDALLLNAMAALCSDPIGDRDEQWTDIATAVSAAAKATLDNPKVAELAVLAGQFEAAFADRGSARWSRLKLDGGRLVASALRQRCADLIRQLEQG